jgi:RNA polymerase sigma-70 factor (ECF subfamily)
LHERRSQYGELRELEDVSPAWESESDEALLVAAPVDSAAFGVFYRRYEGPMLAFCARRTRDPELAADLTAEVFARALESCSRFRPGGAPASAWLFGVAQHVLAKSRRRGAVEDRARRRLGMAPISLDDEDLARIDQLCGDDAAVIGLLGELPADQRDAVRARILDERSYEQIASEMTCSPAVVRKRVSRGLAQLRHQLTQEDT